MGGGVRPPPWKPSPTEGDIALAYTTGLESTLPEARA